MFKSKDKEKYVVMNKKDEKEFTVQIFKGNSIILDIRKSHEGDTFEFNPTFKIRYTRIKR